MLFRAIVAVNAESETTGNEHQSRFNFIKHQFNGAVINYL